MEESKPAERETKECPACGEEILAKARKCKHCREYLDDYASRPGAGGTAPGQRVAPARAVNAYPATRAVRTSLPPMTLYGIYSPTFDTTQLSEEERDACMAHGFVSTFPTAVLVLLHFLTMGLFTTIYHGLKHSELPIVRPDDFTAGKAIGFLFIPFFNLYWFFVFWLRLADRVNFQFALRGRPAPVSRGLLLASLIICLIPYLGMLSGLILFPICVGQIQSACNQLAMEASQRRWESRSA